MGLLNYCDCGDYCEWCTDLTPRPLDYFRAAANWLRCRFEVMTAPFEKISFAQLGEHDWEQEMKRILYELRERRKEN